MIDLGLARIGRLLQHGPPPAWKAIHVAGTNGKGSVCAYLSAMLHARGLPSARFTSPHFVNRWDCIVVDERVVSESPFRAAEEAVLQRDRDEQIGATEFELLTATAFELYGARWPPSPTPVSSSLSSSSAAPAVSPIAVIECGLGGGLDATSAMRAERVVTVITRIGLDHQGLLGNTAAAIAAHKAGIMRPGVPCVVDPANCEDPTVRHVLEARAKEVGAPLVYPEPQLLLQGSGDGGRERGETGGDDAGRCSSTELQKLEPHQLSNLACAYAAFQIALHQDFALASGQSKGVGLEKTIETAPIDTAFLASVVRQLRWPGRLQTIDVGPLLHQRSDSQLPAEPMSVPALLDGAHNPQSADVLAAYVNRHLRDGCGSPGVPSGNPVTWIIAASQGKNLDEMLRPLLRPGDRVAAVTFGPVAGMPWVKPAAPWAIREKATALGIADKDQFGGRAPFKDGDSAHDPNSLLSALQWATSKSGSSGPLVIAGSLYLVSDTLRLLQEAGGETGLPL